jgi:hypothetical protein
MGVDRKWALAGLAGLALLAAPAPSDAVVIDIGVGFESGALPPWTAIGDGFVTGSFGGQSPLSGSFMAGATSGSGSVSAATLETTLGLGAGQLSLVGNGTATEGSAIYRTITVAAGDEIQFSWNFLTDELDQDAVFNDFAFFSVNFVTPIVNEIVDKNSGLFPLPAIGFDGATGWHQYSYVFGVGGTYTIGIGVMDVTDFGVDSAILVDQVPEPGTLLLLGSGLTGLALRRRRRS